MARLEDAIAYQGAQHDIFCSHYGCSKSSSEPRDVHSSPQFSPSAHSPFPALPASISLDAAIYVAVVVIFYALLILLLVGTNLHRFRSHPNQERRNLNQEGSEPTLKHLKVSVSCPPEDSCITVV